MCFSCLSDSNDDRSIDGSLPRYHPYFFDLMHHRPSSWASMRSCASSVLPSASPFMLPSPSTMMYRLRWDLM